MSPYILPNSRAQIDQAVDELVRIIKLRNNDGSWMGDASYVVARLLPGLTLSFGEPRFWHIVALMGIMESAKIEIFKRVASPYEQRMQQERGDVPEFKTYLEMIYPPLTEKEEPNAGHEG